jgi:glycosyltransferase involved in cell wall biosynthesis
MNEYLITVVTPTYNRANYLTKLYASLKQQTCQDFVWLVVDDGSTDHTIGVLEQVRKDNHQFEIQYCHQNNGGKHTALNLAIEKTATELFFIVDSDDILTADAIESIKTDWEACRALQPSTLLCGISYLRGHTVDKPIGDTFPKDRMINSFNHVRVRQHIMGDKAEVWVTDYLRRFRFPVFEGERFLVESWLWVQISPLAPMLFVNKVIYLTEYLEGGLTNSGRKLRINCPRGGMAFSLLMMSSEFPWRDRLKNGILYTTYARFAHQRFIDTLRCKYPVLSTICYLPGIILYRYWNKRYHLKQT